MAGVAGFEPTMAEPKSAALPLGYTPTTEKNPRRNTHGASPTIYYCPKDLLRQEAEFSPKTRAAAVLSGIERVTLSCGSGRGRSGIRPVRRKTGKISLCRLSKILPADLGALRGVAERERICQNGGTGRQACRGELLQNVLKGDSEPEIIKNAFYKKNWRERIENFFTGYFVFPFVFL